jgi:hypothetical protein
MQLHSLSKIAAYHFSQSPHPYTFIAALLSFTLLVWILRTANLVIKPPRRKTTPNLMGGARW